MDRQLKSIPAPADSVTDDALSVPAVNLVERGRGMGDTVLERKTVSIPRACEIVGVSRRTIYNWLAGGKVEYVRTAGGSVRIFEDSLWRDPADHPRQRNWPRARSAENRTSPEQMTSRGA